MKKLKKIKKALLITILTMIVTLIVLVSTDLKYKYMPFADWISIYISIAALLVSIFTIFLNDANKEINNYKNFVIDTLIRKRNLIIKELQDSINAMKQEISINEFPIVDELLNAQIFSNIFTEFYNEINTIFCNYGNNLLGKSDSSLIKDKIYKSIGELVQLRVDFEAEIDKLITQLYIGEIDIKDVK